jgi:Fic family protein
VNEVPSRVGRYVRQPAGYRAFVPAPLPPVPPVRFDGAMLRLLSDATLALGRLDGVGERLPEPDLFVAMYVRREAVLSSQIEGAQSTLQDLLAFELDPESGGQPFDVREVVNYVRAMHYGLERLRTLPLSLRLIREIQGELMTGVRGSDFTLREFRRSQNWIGGTSPANARFVPPSPVDMLPALQNLEQFLHESDLPDLVYCAIAHAQFETIHPFLDGNGRVGRLLITVLLCHRKALRLPLLYLSHYFKVHRNEYYDRLLAVRSDGDWEGWVRFFLDGVLQAAEEATATARSIAGLRAAHLNLVLQRGWGTAGRDLLDLLYHQPLVTPTAIRDRLAMPDKSARRLFQRFVDAGLLEAHGEARRNRRYRYGPYLALFDEDTEPLGG